MSPSWRRKSRDEAATEIAADRFESSEAEFGSRGEYAYDTESFGMELVKEEGFVGRVRAEPYDAVPGEVPGTEAAIAEGVPTPAGGAPVGERVPTWRQMLSVFVENRLAVVSMVVLLIIVLGCYIGPHFYVTNQTNAQLALSQPQNLPPSSEHWLGTDLYGWDVFGRIMFAGQYSLILGLFAGLITIVIGTFYGLTSGWFAGATDGIMMRFLDAFLSIPYLFLLVALVAIFHNSTTFLILVIGLTGWWGNARIIRGEALTIRDLEYSQAARSMGAKGPHIIRRHIYPNTISSIVTVGTFSVADAILFLSALGFLGFGIQQPATDWGTMMNNGTNVLINGYWWELYPVAAVFVIVVLCINYVGDALRDVFEVRLRER